MSHDLIRRVEALGRPRVLVVGDLILDRYVWGDAERISQEAPVPLLRADRREHRLGGAASVATMLRALGAEVTLVGAVGRDPESVIVRKLLADLEIDDRLVFSIDDRPTTLKERYIGRAQDRHPQQMIRVDYEVRDPIPPEVESLIWENVPEAVAGADVVLVSDYDKGVCSPSLLRSIVTACRSLDVRVIVDPMRSSNYAKYRGAHCMTPNRLEAQLATGLTIQAPADALEAGRALLEDLHMECVLVTLDRDGMAMVHSDGREVLVPTRPRQVYDITGAGDMVLSVVGLCMAAGADYDEAAALGNVAGGLEVEKIGVSLLSRKELLRDLLDHRRPDAPKRLDLPELIEEARRRREAGQSIVLINGDFDVMTARLARTLREASTLGDALFVGARSDESYDRDGPGDKPVHAEADRVEVLEALECVDAVVLVDEAMPEALIRSLRPDVLVVANKDDAGREAVEASGGRVVIASPFEEGRTTRFHLRDAGNSLKIHAPGPAIPGPSSGRRSGATSPQRPVK